MCLVRVISSDQGSGTDSAYVAMGKGDNALAGATSEVGGGTLMVAMIGRPAVATTLVIRAVASFMSRVFAMALEAVNMRGEGTLSLAK